MHGVKRPCQGECLQVWTCCMVSNGDVKACWHRLFRRWRNSGVPLEPFSLKREREAGYFDDEGFFVAYKDDELEDAWLASLPRGAHAVAPHPCLPTCCLRMRILAAS